MTSNSEKEKKEKSKARKPKKKVARRKETRRKLAPKRLGEKLRSIRTAAGLSQTDVHRIMMPDLSEHHRAMVSQYESGRRTPSLIEIFNFAKHFRIAVELLLDDEREWFQAKTD